MCHYVCNFSKLLTIAGTEYHSGRWSGEAETEHNLSALPRWREVSSLWTRITSMRSALTTRAWISGAERTQKCHSGYALFFFCILGKIWKLSEKIWVGENLGMSEFRISGYVQCFYYLFHILQFSKPMKVFSIKKSQYLGPGAERIQKFHSGCVLCFRFCFLFFNIRNLESHLNFGSDNLGMSFRVSRVLFLFLLFKLRKSLKT